MNFKKVRKTVSPVIATALLLVVAVVAVVGFEKWFDSYQSNVLAEVEQKSFLGEKARIESLIGNFIYFKNLGEALIISEVKVGENYCNFSSADLKVGISKIELKDCVISQGVQRVLVLTDKGILEKKFFIENGIPDNSLDCSSLNGGDWIKVPGNSELGTDDFCVMKFEAKNDGSNNPISKPSGNPWVNINQINAKSECESLGQGYKLISNSQWTTIARNAELVNSNWNSGTVGSGSMFRGHSDNSPSNALSVTNVNNFFDQTGNSGNSEQRRVLTLSNGATIWDFAGNVWEWNSDACSQGDPWYYSSSWIEWTDSNINGAEKTLAGPKGNYDSSNGVGKYFGCTRNGNAFRRGGGWNNGVNSGAFALILNVAPSDTYMGMAFRCSYEE